VTAPPLGGGPLVESLVVTHTLIYPQSSRQNEAGHLEIGGCDVVSLAETCGTPLLIYDEQALRDQCRAYVAAFASRIESFEIVYASKAFTCVAMCQLAQEEGLSLDVASGGELFTARVAGFPPERVYFHGNNKSVEEMELGLSMGIGAFVVDSFEEIALLDALAARHGRRQTVLVRLTPGIRPATHSHVQTGQQDSKFGFSIAGAVAETAVAACLAAPHLELVGVHAHLGSQIFDLSSYEAEVKVLFGAAAGWRDRLGFVCAAVNLGGGLGIRYTARDQPSSIGDFAEVAVEAARVEAARHGLPLPRLLVEPGRSIAGKAAVTAYRVGVVKEVPGARTYVAVDGGMSDNIRPMLYGQRYEAMLASKADVPATVEVTVAGKHCESGDVLVRDVAIAPPEPGDVLVTPGTGAYGYAMANNYNGQPRPAVVFVKDGGARVVIERETWQDVVRLQRRLWDDVGPSESGGSSTWTL
jgi:diaminopimelate decarboxylase